MCEVKPVLQSGRKKAAPGHRWEGNHLSSSFICFFKRRQVGHWPLALWVTKKETYMNLITVTTAMTLRSHEESHCQWKVCAADVFILNETIQRKCVSFHSLFLRWPLKKGNYITEVLVIGPTLTPLRFGVCSWNKLAVSRWTATAGSCREDVDSEKRIKRL